jgi:hypothetical protein
MDDKQAFLFGGLGALLLCGAGWLTGTFHANFCGFGLVFIIGGIVGLVINYVRLKQRGTPAGNDADAADQPRRKSWRSWAILGGALGVFLLLIVTFVAYVWHSAAEMRDSARAFCAATLDELMPGYNGAALYDRGDDRYRAETSPAQLSDTLKEHFLPNGAYRGYAFEQWELKQDDGETYVRLVYTLDFQNAAPHIEFYLQQEDDGWVIRTVYFYPEEER